MLSSVKKRKLLKRTTVSRAGLSEDMRFKLLLNNEKGASSAKRLCEQNVFQAEVVRERMILK